MLFGGNSYESGLELAGGMLVYEPGGAFKHVTAPGEPPLRWRHMMFWTGREVIVWGGAAGLNPLRDGALFDPELETWRPMTATGGPTGGGLDVAGVWTGDSFLVWGKGDTGTSTGAQYDPETDSWSPISLDGPPPRVWHSMVWGGGEAYVYGGQDTSGNATAGEEPGNRVYSMWAYRPATDTWRKVNDEGRSSGTKAIWADGHLVMWGGSCPTGSIYDPNTDSWATMTTENAPSPRSPAFAAETPDGVLFYGGNTHHSNLTDGGVFSF